MFKPIFIMSTLLFATENSVLFSVLSTERLGLGLQWKPWKLKYIEVYDSGQLYFFKEKSSTKKSILNLKEVMVSYFVLDNVNETSFNPLIKKEVGLHIKCKNSSNIETYFRCILNENEYEKFLVILHQISNSKIIPKTTINNLNNSKISVSTQSVMRRAITHAMDTYIIQSQYDKILQRRGAMKYLPVYFSNDLIHGSWYVEYIFLLKLLFTCCLFY